ncbi:MAG: DUF433 domain-containing protein [Bacteroidia bacterium]|nr:DUF433 domain-containing protein [Bacteroidia bacterium]
MKWQEYLEVKPDVMMGKAVIKGTRITAEQVLRELADGNDNMMILEYHPGITEQAIRACIAYALDVLTNEIAYRFSA